MKHTLYRNWKREDDLLTMQTNGPEGTVAVHLSTVRKVKIMFPSVAIATDGRTYRLDLTNVQPSEFLEIKQILTDAMRKNRTANNTPEGIRQPADVLTKPSA
jgi:hypothetical protein